MDGVGPHGEPREARDGDHRAQPADRPRRRHDERLHHHHPVAGPPRRHPERPGRSRGMDARPLRPQAPADRDQRGAETSSQIPAPAALAARLAAVNRERDGRRLRSRTSTSAGSRSWSRTAVPGRRTGRPWSRCRSRSSMRRSRASCGRWPGSAAFLLLAGGLAALFTARQVERPLRIAVRSGHGSEEAGQRTVRAIARPPGGGAPTHRPRAARLDGPAPRRGEPRACGLEAEVRQSPAGRKTVAEIEGPARPRRCGNCASSPTCCIRRTWRRTVSRPRCGSSPKGSRGGRGSSRGSGFRRRSTTLRRTSSVRSCGWCRRRSPTSIAMPAPRTCRSMPGSCPDGWSSASATTDRAWRARSGPTGRSGWASALRACAPAWSSSAAT